MLLFIFYVCDAIGLLCVSTFITCLFLCPFIYVCDCDLLFFYLKHRLCATFCLPTCSLGSVPLKCVEHYFMTTLGTFIILGILCCCCVLAIGFFWLSVVVQFISYSIYLWQHFCTPFFTSFFKQSLCGQLSKIEVAVFISHNEEWVYLNSLPLALGFLRAFLF